MTLTCSWRKIIAIDYTYSCYNSKSIELKFFFNLIDTAEVVTKDNYYNKFYENKYFLDMHFKVY